MAKFIVDVVLTAQATIPIEVEADSLQQADAISATAARQVEWDEDYGKVVSRRVFGVRPHEGTWRLPKQRLTEEH